MIKQILSIVLVIVCLSCDKSNNSGKNPEHKQVLNHYSAPGDSLKFRAARYLIEHMEEQRHVPPGPVRKYYRLVDSISGLRVAAVQKEEIVNSLSVQYLAQIPLVKDNESLSAAFLIKEIDNAFFLWENKPWAQHLNFDQFCEYLLPYKVKNNQVLDNWREFYGEKFPLDEDEFIHTLPYRNSALRACDLLNREIRVFMNSRKKEMLRKKLQAFVLPTGVFEIDSDNCDVNSFITATIMRSAGIPVAIDYTPLWPHKEPGHSWNVLIASSGKEIAFGGPFEDVDRLHKPYEKIGKVYRETYRTNPDLIRLYQTGQWVPDNFKNPCIRDVTDRYCETVDISVPVEANYKRQERYAWLANFSISGWKPVAFGEIKMGLIHFKKAGKDVLYLPLAGTSERMVSLSYPFILSLQGEIHTLKPDRQDLRTVKLTRKYPVRENVYEAGKKIAGGEIQASNEAAFTNYKVIYKIPGRELAGEVAVADTAPYRYWRYFSPDSGYCNLSELIFYGTDHEQATGKVIGTDEPGDAGNSKYAVFDNDPLTSFRSVTDPRAWVGMDFGEARRLIRIVYSPRTDDNNIRIGDEYELFYHDIQGWVSLGKKRAETISLHYDGVPANALLWLRNLSKGREERPFTYENDRQVWW